MKRLIVLFLAILALASCGQKQSGKTLQISSTMALTNAGFTGGLVVTGSMGGTNKFTANAIGGTSIVVPLVDGTWTFHVVGWEGSTPFTGVTQCGSTTANLDSGTSSINISLSPTNCAGTNFTQGVSNLTDANGFEEIKLYTCGSIVVGGSPIDKNTAAGSFDSGFCSGLPVDLSHRAQSFKFEIPGNLMAGQTFPAISSGCVFTSDSPKTLSGLKLPTHQIPVVIHLFNTSDCTGEKLTYSFKDGLLANTYDHGGFLHNLGTSNNGLILPFNFSQFGHSPLYSLMPMISCNTGGFCATYPDLPTGANGANLMIQAGSDRSSRVVLSRDSSYTCQNFSFSGFTGLVSEGCEDKDGSISLRIKEENMDDCQTGGCSFVYSINGGASISKTVYSDNSPSYHVYQNVYRQLGGDASSSLHIRDSLEAFNEKSFSYGAIRWMRENLGPEGPLGAFGNVSCTNMAGEKVMGRLEEGQLKFLKVIAKNTSQAIPAQIQSAQTQFNKQIIFRELINSTWRTVQNIYVNCTHKIGAAEGVFTGHDGEYRDEQELVFWNTQDEASAKVELYRFENEYFSSSKSESNLKMRRTSFDHIQKATSGADWYMMNHSFEQWKLTANSTTQYERLSKQEFGAEDTTNDIFQSNIHLEVGRPVSSSISIFGIAPAGKEVYFTPRLDIQASNGAAGMFNDKRYNFDYDEAGNYKALVYSYDGGSTRYIKLKFFDGSTWQDFTVSSMASPSMIYSPRIAVNSSGKAVVAFLKENGGAHNVYYGLLDLSSPPSLTNSDFKSFNGVPRGLDVSVDSSNRAVVFWAESFNGEGWIWYNQFNPSGPAWDTTPTEIWHDNDISEILGHSLKATLRSDENMVLTWFEDGGTNLNFRSSIYDPTVGTENARAGSPQALSVTQPESSSEPISYSAYAAGSDVYSVWSLDNNNTYVAKLSSGQSQFGLPVTTPISVKSYIGLSEFTDSFEFTAGAAGGGTTSSFFPASPIVPIKSGSGFSTQPKSMNPATFNGLFTPISTFINIQ